MEVQVPERTSWAFKTFFYQCGPQTSSISPTWELAEVQIQGSTPNLLAQKLFFHHLHKCTLEADRLLGSAVERRELSQWALGTERLKDGPS